jgi:endoglucanase
MKFLLFFIAALALPFALSAESHAAWPFWNAYVSHFVSPDGRVIDPDRNSMTTSEGQSYAMFFALVADDASSFERIRSWTEQNLARGDLSENLPAWSWGRRGDGAWGALDQNSAADADLWIAYSLIQAGNLWQNPAYSRSGKALLQQIAKEEVGDLPGVGPVLMPGRVELFSSSGRWVLNPSYSPLPLLFAAAHAEPDGPWKQMAKALPGWLGRASPSGFAMDWVADAQGQFAAISNPGDLSRPPCGSYDAIRVYLWAGMTNPKTPGADQILEIFSPMARLMRATASPPEIVSPHGFVLSHSAPVGFSAALIPFLSTSGVRAAAVAQQKLVAARFDRQTDLLDAHPRYYDQNLALFALGWQEQRFRFAPDGELRVQWRHF